MKINPDIETFFNERNHPLETEIRKVREIILAADERITEAIKWKSPTFMYKGNIASFFMNAKQFVSLMFHEGALLDNPHGLLEGDGKEARVARFQDMADIERKEAALTAVIKAWIKFKDEK